MFINKVVKIKGHIESLKNELKENGCSEVEVKERIKTAIIDPVNQLKLAISTKEISKLPKDFLDDEAINKIEEFLSAYPKSYKFKKNSIYYDAKACPGKHLFAYYKLAKICEDSGIKSFNCLLIRKTYIPCRMTIDTKILNNHILKNSRQSKLDK